MEQDLNQGGRLPHGKGQRRDTDQDDLGGAPRNREDHLAEVETQGGRRVQVQIDMMHQVKAPEERNLVNQNVPDVQQVVLEHDGERNFEPAR